MADQRRLTFDLGRNESYTPRIFLFLCDKKDLVGQVKSVNCSSGKFTFQFGNRFDE